MAVLAVPVTGATTEVTVIRFASDNLTPVMDVTHDYHWMEENLPVHGDGTTRYYSQGPTFNVSDPWDDAESQNIATRDWGAVMGTDVRDLCNLVGGASPGHPVSITGSDGLGREFSYESVAAPDPRQGPLVVSWYKDGMYPDSGYDEGMRLIMFADARVATPGWNLSGLHVFGNADMRDTWDPQFWYFFDGKWPSSGGTSVKVVRFIHVFTPDPVPPPVAGFSANIRTGRVINGDFEGGTTLDPWSTGTTGATLHTGSVTYRHGDASVKLAATPGTPAWIRQDVDLTGVGSITLWRYQFGGLGKYLEVSVDGIPLAIFKEESAVTGASESIDISSFGFTGTHTVKLTAVSKLSGTFTVYLDDITDYGPGMYGDAPLTVRFRDLSTKTEDASRSGWAWDFDNDGITDSTVRNPTFTYPVNGTYTVRLMTTNAGGSDTEVKPGYIVAGSPAASFSVNATTGALPLAVRFTDTSSGNPTAWNWSFGDGSWYETADPLEKDPVHTYLSAGIFTARLTACNPNGCDTTATGTPITVTRPLVPLPGYMKIPTDPDGDGIHEDLNANGRKDFADVVLFFSQMIWIAQNEPVAAFDLNYNGRIDFADIVALFNEI